MADDIDLTEFETDELLRGDGVACDWPLLTDWTAIRYAGEICFEGIVSGHPRLKDGAEIRTSGLRRLTRDRAYAQTHNTLYRLGEPAKKPLPEHIPDILQLVSSPDWDAAYALLMSWTTPRAPLSPLSCREALRELRPGLPWAERRRLIAVIRQGLSVSHGRLADIWSILGTDPDEWSSCRLSANVVSAAFNLWTSGRGGAVDATGRRMKRTVAGWQAMADNGHTTLNSADQDPIALAHSLGEMMATDETDVLKEEAIEREADLLVKSVPPLRQRQPEPAGPGVVVITKIGGNAKDWRNQPSCADFRPLEGKKLPLAEVPDLAQARATLAAEFPYACGAIDIMLSDLIRRATFRPTLFAGEPGGGKSRLASRIAEVTGLHVARYDGSGSNDASFAGCARHWSTAEPSFALAAVRDSGTANPVILIDEIDKATKSHNGGLAQSLLPLLESETAKKYPDIYISAPVDLSHVSYILTANDERLLPKPLRDRLRILRIPTPTVDHIFPLSKNLVRELAAERGIDPAFVQPIDGDELAVAAMLWPQGGSIRRLRAIIERILARRDEQAPRH